MCDNVVDLSAFKQKKALTGRNNGLATLNGETDRELAIRIERIKASIQRINKLMTELRGENNESI